MVVRRKDVPSFTLDFTQGAAYLEVETEYDEPEYFYDIHPLTNTPRTIRRVNLSVVRPRADLQTGVVYTLRERNLDE